MMHLLAELVAQQPLVTRFMAFGCRQLHQVNTLLQLHMILKHRDARTEMIKALEKQCVISSDNVKRSACASAISRLRADPTTEWACDLIDAQFGQSEDWIVIHDLRLRVDAHALQINHLLINNRGRFFCIDSRFLQYGLDINDSGQCHAFDRIERRAVASPIRKMARELRMLRSYIHSEGLMPRRFSIAARPNVRGYIITNPSLRLSVCQQQVPTNIGLCPSNAMFSLLWYPDQRSHSLLNRQLTSEEQMSIAGALINAHQPTFSPNLLLKDSLATAQTRQLLSSAY